ncbi:tRNA-uridine aminocarboxypropyltransferase 2-like [Melanerpes formicivorus]|uniref:tRNA-uridine aminocarboxypropyltransferase 2-like n=1 Tax=Melanerpes formicivorus TaxID=211600 RepID=UPI00358F5609
MERSCAAAGSGAASASEDESCVGLWDLPVERSERRPECARCSRPQKVCLCPFLPIHPLKVSTCLYIIQHPAEESRVLRTVPLLAACLPPDKCKILVGRRFSEDRLLGHCHPPGRRGLDEQLFAFHNNQRGGELAPPIAPRCTQMLRWLVEDGLEC